MSRQHRRALPNHMIEQAWEVYSDFTHKQNGAPQGETDKLHFLGGFAACIGVLVGTLDVGIEGGTPTQDVMSKLVNEEIPRYQSEIIALTEAAKRRQN